MGSFTPGGWSAHRLLEHQRLEPGQRVQEPSSYHRPRGLYPTYRGPVIPLCTESVPCTAPLRGSFTIWQDGKVETRFQTDEKGYFRVALEPGVYSITVANLVQTALLRPDQKIISVNADGMTKITLSFDTGIY